MLLKEMPADPGNIDQVHFFTVWLLDRFWYPDSEFLRKSPVYDKLPKFFSVIYFNADHKVFSKLFVTEFLHNKLTVIFFKTYIVSSVPVYFKSRSWKSCFDCSKLLPDGRKGSNERNFIIRLINLQLKLSQAKYYSFKSPLHPDNFR